MPKAIFFLNENDTYDGPEPYFFEPSDFSWSRILEENWHIIKEEFAPIIEGKEQISLSSPNPPYLSNPNAWKNIYFWNFMWQYHANCKRFPKTFQLLKSVPNLTFAEFTILEPHSRVLPHIGETNTIIRGHLGLSIPAQLPIAGIQVGNQERSWEEGKVVLFSDCHRHTVWNESDKRRVVMIFDITKDEYSHQKSWVNAQSLAALTIKYLAEKFAFFKKFPKSIIQLIHFSFSIAWWIYLPFQRNILRLFYGV